MKIFNFRNYVFILWLISLSGCVTTALFGAQFVPKGDDVYTLNIGYGLAEYNRISTDEIEKETRKILDREAIKFVESHEEYTTYNVVRFYRSTSLLQYMIYTVKFSSEKL